MKTPDESPKLKWNCQIITYSQISKFFSETLQNKTCEYICLT